MALNSGRAYLIRQSFQVSHLNSDEWNLAQFPVVSFIQAFYCVGIMKNASSPSAPLICTIGHSNRSIATFLDLLEHNQVTHVLDVRTVPRSRHNPQFNRDTLPASLATHRIAYTYLPALGGLRHTHKDSINLGWHNLSFRGYADYMQTAEFADNVQRVAELAASERCALMCAEAVPWRCHRSMIGDALLIRGIRVEDIIGPKERRVHKLTSFAHVEGTRITYPPDEISIHQT
jgi:uncharacterized protein (DUF488 family)